MRRMVLLILGLGIGMSTFGQAMDSITSAMDSIASATDSIKRVTENIDFLYQMLLEQTEDRLTEEFGFENGKDEASHEELIEDYLYYLEHPVNINSKEVVHLEEIGLLSAFQVRALEQYRRSFGDLMFVEELTMLDGFSETTAAVIAPLVHFGKSELVQEREKVSVKKAFTQGRHQVTLNYAEKFGETTDEDYLGSPRKLQMKYAYHYQQKLRFGIAMEKDAGEPFFFNGLDDSLREVVGQRRSPGFDFYGAHLYVTDVTWGDADDGISKHGVVIQDLAIGDYQLSFGQGLTLWSGMSFGKGANGSSLMKRGAGVRPKASSSEGQFFRGAATTLRYRDCHVTAFYSNRRIDATLAETDTIGEDFEEGIDEVFQVSALQESGYHRTLNELSKRNTLRQQVFGGHLCYAGPQLELGCTFYHLRLSAPLKLKPSRYNQFYYQGNRLTDMGLDFRWLLGKAAFFGEFSRSDNGAFAGLIGATLKPHGYINFSLLYRNYDKRYQSMFNGAFAESSRGQGEEGWYLGLQCAPAPGWDLLAYCDFFRLTWLSSQVYHPSWGQEYSLKLTHQISRNASMQFRFKTKTKMKNSSDEHVFSHYPIFYSKQSVHFQISYGITDDLVFSDKVSYSQYRNDDGACSRGYLLCHDVSYKPEGKPYSLTFRYALFDSDDYYSRICIYENDVLGAFSIPSLYGHGSRAYLLGKVRLFGGLSLYSRIGVKVLSEETQADVKVEAVWKF